MRAQDALGTLNSTPWFARFDLACESFQNLPHSREVWRSPNPDSLFATETNAPYRNKPKSRISSCHQRIFLCKTDLTLIDPALK